MSLGKTFSLHQRNTHRAEIGRSDDAIFGINRLARQRDGAPFDLEGDNVSATAEGKRADGPDRFDVRQFCDAAQILRIKTGDLCILFITGGRERNVRGQYALWMKARINLLQSHKALDHEARAD